MVLPFGLLLLVLNGLHARRLRRRPLPTGFAPPTHWVLDTDRGARLFAVLACAVLVPMIVLVIVTGAPQLVVGATTTLVFLLVTAVGAALTALSASVDPLPLLAQRLANDPAARRELDILREGLRRAPGTVPFA